MPVQIAKDLKQGGYASGLYGKPVMTKSRGGGKEATTSYSFGERVKVSPSKFLSCQLPSNKAVCSALAATGKSINNDHTMILLATFCGFLV